MPSPGGKDLPVPSLRPSCSGGGQSDPAPDTASLCDPTGSEYDEEEVDYEESDSDESWTTESAISSEAILSSMCMNGGEEKPFACPVPGCKKRYKVKKHRLTGHSCTERGRKGDSRLRCSRFSSEAPRVTCPRLPVPCRADGCAGLTETQACGPGVWAFGGVWSRAALWGAVGHGRFFWWEDHTSDCLHIHAISVRV